MTCQLVVEIDPYRAGDVPGLIRGPAIATVEIPMNIGQDGLGMSGDELAIDEGLDH
jgi:hypothetical protein